jgi:hypothetical protein
MSCLFDCFTDDNMIQNEEYIPQNIMLPTIKKKKKTIKKVDKSTQTDIIPKKKKSNKMVEPYLAKRSKLDYPTTLDNEPGSRIV